MIFLRNESLGSGDGFNEKLKLPLSDDLNDTSQYNNIVTATGIPFFEDGALRTSEGNYATIGLTDNLQIRTDSFEFGCDIKVAQFKPQRMGIMGKSVYIQTAGRYAFYIEGNQISAITHRNSYSINTAQINDNNWHSVKCVCDRSIGRQYLLLDGNIISEVSISIEKENYTHNGKFFIGAYGDTTGLNSAISTGFNGWIKNVFFNKF